MVVLLRRWAGKRARKRYMVTAKKVVRCSGRYAGKTASKCQMEDIILPGWGCGLFYPTYRVDTVCEIEHVIRGGEGIPAIVERIYVTGN